LLLWFEAPLLFSEDALPLEAFPLVAFPDEALPDGIVSFDEEKFARKRLDNDKKPL
jgi:hypothetical protein